MNYIENARDDFEKLFKEANPNDYAPKFKVPHFKSFPYINYNFKRIMNSYNSLSPEDKYNRFVFPYFELSYEYLSSRGEVCSQLFIEYFYDEKKHMDKIDPDLKYYLFDTLTDCYMFMKHQEINDILYLSRENMIRLKNTTEIIRKSLASYYKNSGIKISCIDDAGKEISFKKALINQAKKDNFITDNFELINEFTEEVIGHPYKSYYRYEELSAKYGYVKSEDITEEILKFMIIFMRMYLCEELIEDDSYFKYMQEKDISKVKADVRFLFEKNKESVRNYGSYDITDFEIRRYSFEVKELFWLCVNNYLKNNNISFKKDKDALSYLNTKGVLSDTDIEQYNKFNSEVRNTFSHEGYKNNLTIEKINDIFNVM